MLDVSESTVRRWLHRQKLEGFKVDGVVRVDRRSIEEMAKKHGYADVKARQLARSARPSARRWSPDLSRSTGTSR